MASFIQIIQLIRWPLTIIILSWIFRKPLSELLPYIKTIKYRDFEAKFSRKLEDLKRDAKNLPCSIDVVASDMINVKDETKTILETDGIEFYSKLAKIDPRSAIIEAWRKLQLSINEKAKKLGVKQNTIIETVVRLNRARLIDDGEKHMILELRKMRNEAIYAPSFQLTFLDAVRYADLANRLTCYIQDRKL